MTAAGRRPGAACAALLVVLALVAAASATGPESMRAKGVPAYKTAERNASLLWGSYRPNLYFGLRTRHPESLLAGLMWFDPNRPDALERVRHRCEHGRESGLESYGWQAHDGATYGRHVADDAANGVVVTASFVKASSGSAEGDAAGGDVGVRIRVEPRRDDEKKKGRGRGGEEEGEGEGAGRAVALVFYLALQSPGAWAGLHGEPRVPPKGLEGGARLDGWSPDVGDFSLVVPHDAERAERGMELPRALRKFKHAPDAGRVHYAGLRMEPAEAWRAEERLKVAMHGEQARLRHLLAGGPSSAPSRRREGAQAAVPPALPNAHEGNATVWAFQVLVAAPATLDLAFLSRAGRPSPADIRARAAALTGEALTGLLEAGEERFEGRFEGAFGLAAKGLSARVAAVTRHAFANLLGGVGYFHGRWLVQGEEGERPAATLVTAVPSRPFFPRGFLWDEGFHQLLVAPFDRLLTYEVLAGWLALQDPDGWIAREQILGEEARSKVPPEFRAQVKEHANPPSYILALDALLRAAGPPALRRPAPLYLLRPGARAPDVPAGGGGGLEADGALVDFLEEAYGPLRKHLDWLAESQAGPLNGTFRWRGRSPDGMHTLASGLDDYPRAPIPLPTERHVDLLCWVAAAGETLARAATVLGRPAEEGARLLNLSRTALDALDEGHWNMKLGLYSDYIASPEHLRMLNEIFAARIRELDPTAPGHLERLKNLPQPPTTPYVENMGYVNLFPVLFGAVGPESPRLGATLDLLQDPQRLWSPYGLRSLALSDPLFAKGENYWRGPIWMNVNYLALRALKLFYAPAPGPHRERAASLYAHLRSNLLENVAREYARTGYVWEQYSGTTGEGLKSHPFTGWSALVTLIAAEIY
eukprot:tig00020537_g10278.t1